MKKPHDIMLK